MDLSTDAIFGVAVGLAFSAYVVLAYRLVARAGRRRVEGEKQAAFHNALLSGLRSGAIDTIEDVLNVHQALTGVHADDATYRHSVTVHLRQFLADLVSGRLGGDVEEHAVLEWKRTVTSFIRENEEASPYADLPAAERTILADLSLLVEEGDKESTKRRLAELVGMIQARHDDFLRVQAVNRYTVPLSIGASAMTILLSVMSIVAR